MEEETKKMIILEHYEHPLNRGLINDENYIKVNMNSESCIDEITLMVKVKDGIIKDIRFDGEACAICTSSTSIMIETLIGKKIEDVKNIISSYYSMIDEKEYDKNILENAIVYEDISTKPNRKKCALLSWMGIDKIVNKK